VSSIRKRLDRLEKQLDQEGVVSGDPIGVDRAEVKTCSVEVKVIRIDRKQMTLAVFRQIPSEPILDGNTLKLNGLPWGLIRYNGVHLLWQKDKELRTCPLLLTDECDGSSEYYGFTNRRSLRWGQQQQLRHPEIEEVLNDLRALDQLFIAV
jgi:hypothetical protein